MRPLNRVDSQTLPVQGMRTFEIQAPRATHTRPATCAETDCRAGREGWTTACDLTTVQGARVANHIRLKSGRAYAWSQVGQVVTFRFPAGQQCFAQHRVPIERPEVFVVRGGDWRAHLGVERVHTRADLWVEDFQENLARHRQLVQRG